MARKTTQKLCLATTKLEKKLGTYKREVEGVLMVSPPEVGADVLGANILSVARNSTAENAGEGR